MKNDIRIRRAELEDLKAINVILNHSILNSSSNWAWTVRSYEDAVEWFKQHNTKKYCIFVSEQDGNITGYASLSKMREKEGYWPVVENSVYVHKDYRGMKIGEALLVKLIHRANECDIWAISAWIDSGNVASIKLHEKYDFYKAGELKNNGDKFGEKRSVTIMQLDLARMGN